MADGNNGCGDLHVGIVSRRLVERRPLTSRLPDRDQPELRPVTATTNRKRASSSQPIDVVASSVGSLQLQIPRRGSRLSVRSEAPDEVPYDTDTVVVSLHAGRVLRLRRLLRGVALSSHLVHGRVRASAWSQFARHGTLDAVPDHERAEFRPRSPTSYSLHPFIFLA
ncbi:hypothetical protein PR202_gb26869 [Eleusine coracana subsp. coracana]|uniref:Uncharacterized protein n=1 Tax=Eleusine coracana subsp. coracana TaxID=191504 RepID=A0AAV5FT81_ELECO|nr:hypothetical protein PR202_gb26869 [Eleusine coracana subsp. coracana]